MMLMASIDWLPENKDWYKMKKSCFKCSRNAQQK